MTTRAITLLHLSDTQFGEHHAFGDPAERRIIVIP
jgi:hypothetical protein